MMLLVLSCSLSHLVSSQATDTLIFTNAEELAIIGKALPGKNPYHRVDTTTFDLLPANIKKLLTCSSGLAVRFNTSSTVIAAKWCVTNAKPREFLTPVANKGLDLYIKRNDKWEYAGAAAPDGQCSEAVIVNHMEAGEKECLLYLPLYDAVDNVKIGIERKAGISAGTDPFSKRILVYGSSIVMGASASRPGLAYPARMTRATGLHFLNLGLSGSAKMEKETANMIGAIDADAYVLDCVPNSSAAQIKERTQYLVTNIRQSHPGVPIVIMQSIVREGGTWDQTIAKRVAVQNDAIEEQYNILVKKGIEDLYFIRGQQLLGTDHEGSVDGTHPNDLGFDRMIQKLLPQFLQIFKQYFDTPPYNGKTF